MAVAPATVSFTDEKAALTLTQVLSGSILLSSLFTRSECGLFRKIPYKTHLVIDTLGGATALVAPWSFGLTNNTRARNTFLAMGAFGLMAGLLSKLEEMPA